MSFSLSLFLFTVWLGLVPIFACLSHSLGHSICCRSEKGNQSSSSLISMSISAAAAVPGNVDCHVSGAITSLCLRRKKERKNEPETASSAAVWPYQLIDCPFSLSLLSAFACSCHQILHSLTKWPFPGRQQRKQRRRQPEKCGQKQSLAQKRLHCHQTEKMEKRSEKVVRVSHSVGHSPIDHSC